MSVTLTRPGSVKINLSGQRFGRLYALRDVGSTKYGRLWYCICVCGGRSTVPSARLRNGSTSSCGCKKIDRVRAMGLINGRRFSEEIIGQLWELKLLGLQLDEALV